MHIAMLNPQANFDSNDSYWTEHPDFGGQLVYVKEVALALADQGCQVDIITRQIVDEQWPEFAAPIDRYPGQNGVRIVRIPCGPKTFLPKEQLWPYLGTEWVQGILKFYEDEERLPDIFSAHYADGGLCAAILRKKTGIPFTFTGHSLGAQKMEKFQISLNNLAQLDERFLFRRRIVAERVAMNHAAKIITSTRQEQQEQYCHPAYQQAVKVSDKQRFAVTPPGVNQAVFSTEESELDVPIQARMEAAMSRDLSKERLHLPLVVYSSRLDRKKNHIALVKAFAQSKRLRSLGNIAMVVRGLEGPLQDARLAGEEGDILAEIKTCLDVHDLWKMVTTFSLNSQDELAAAYRVAASKRSVFALTALYEPFGLAPLEAMSCGLPAVVTQNGGPMESLYDARTRSKYGVLIDPSNPADIARGLLEILATPEQWQRYQQAGLERVITRYTWGSTANGYRGVFDEMLKRSSAFQTSIPIPDYFLAPTPENDLTSQDLAALYFQN